MILTTQDLEKRYGDHYALRDVNVSVEHGSIYGLVGPNGSGKTTLLSIVAGLRHVTSGSINLGVDRSKIALLPDTPHFEPWLTAEEVVDLARHLVSPEIPRARVREVLVNAGLEHAIERRAGGFSRGMLQRLGLASALIGAPQLLMLDEPASALDPAGRRDVLDLIARERGRTTVLFSSHILADVQEVCDTVGILREGGLLYEGPISTLLTGTATPTYHVRLRADNGSAERTLAQEPWVEAVTALAPDELRVAVHSVDDAEQHLAAALARAGARVVSMGPEEASLERAFLQLTKQGH